MPHESKAARSTVSALANEVGFEGVDAGHLDASRNIENLGLLVGQLAYGSGSEIAFRCVLLWRRESFDGHAEEKVQLY